MNTYVSNQRFKCIIFDLDGTIADTVPFIITAFKRAIEPYVKRTISAEEIAATFGPSEEGTCQWFVPDNADAAVDDYIRYYEEEHYRCPAPYKGIRELLCELKRRGVNLGMVTGKGPRSTTITLKYYGLDEMFDRVETGTAAGANKAGGMRSILSHFVISPTEAVYIGDSPSDIIAARDAGVTAYSAAWAENADTGVLAAQRPDEIFSTVAELSKALLTQI